MMAGAVHSDSRQGAELIDQAAQGPDVGFLVVWGLVDLFLQGGGGNSFILDTCIPRGGEGVLRRGCRRERERGFCPSQGISTHRGHVEGCSDIGVRKHGALRQDSSQAEVSQLDIVGGIEEDVARFQVTVQD